MPATNGLACLCVLCHFAVTSAPQHGGGLARRYNLSANGTYVLPHCTLVLTKACKAMSERPSKVRMYQVSPATGHARILTILSRGYR